MSSTLKFDDSLDFKMKTGWPNITATGLISSAEILIIASFPAIFISFDFSCSGHPLITAFADRFTLVKNVSITCVNVFQIYIFLISTDLSASSQSTFSDRIRISQVCVGVLGALSNQ